MKDFKTQVYVVNLFGKEIRIDLFGEGDNGTIYIIEFQRDVEGTGPIMVRYITGMVDTKMIVDKGDKYKNIEKVVLAKSVQRWNRNSVCKFRNTG